MAGVAVNREGPAAATAAAAAGVGGVREVVVGMAARLIWDRCSYTGACGHMRRQPRWTTGPSGRPVPRSGSRSAPRSCRLRAMCRVGAGQAALSWPYRDELRTRTVKKLLVHASNTRASIHTNDGYCITCWTALLRRSTLQGQAVLNKNLSSRAPRHRRGCCNPGDPAGTASDTTP